MLLTIVLVNAEKNIKAKIERLTIKEVLEREIKKTMFEYEIYYRLDQSEFLETDIAIVNADSISEIQNKIREIERNNTIINIINKTMNIK
jgi:hypothetical protein